MKLKKLNLDSFDSQLQNYSPKAIRQQLNCLAANVNRLIDAVNDISEHAEEPVKYESTKPDLKPCPFCGGGAEFIIDVLGFPHVKCTRCGALIKIAKKCDRCKSLYEEDCTPDLEIYDYRHTCVSARVDLCPKCLSKLESWITKEEEFCNDKNRNN